ncbi:MAG: OsmC family protein [Planctomycetota bacterium]
MNNINKNGIRNFLEEAKKDDKLFFKTRSLQGRWNFEHGKPQFQANIVFGDNKQTTFETDLAVPMGGFGNAPDPMSYCFFGLLSCFTATIASVATEHNIFLEKLESSITVSLDTHRVYNINENPITEKIQIEISLLPNTDKKLLDNIIEESKRRCPAIYCLIHPIQVDVRLK